MNEPRKLNLNKKWVKEVNKWREENKETFLKLTTEEHDIMLMDWLIDKLDEMELKLIEEEN